ncbi:hypothetical protein ACFYY5_29580 [Nocardia elegans]|uniref:Uncharacterized protein n=1 Tax=Nocardia elegans TaxID=300029 RepID=A0ABW6TMG6_9NOCA
MAFTPVRMTRDGIHSVLVGSATEREHLLAHGYSVVEPEKPAPKAAPVKRVEASDKNTK